MWWLINSFIFHNAEGWKPNIMPLVDSEKACFLVQRGAVSWFTKVLLLVHRKSFLSGGQRSCFLVHRGPVSSITKTSYIVVHRGPTSCSIEVLVHRDPASWSTDILLLNPQKAYVLLYVHIAEALRDRYPSSL